MDGFDNDFGGAPAAASTEVDPAAEFLANEQRELADLTDELDLTSQPPQEVESSAMNGSPVTNGHEAFFDMDGNQDLLADPSESYEVIENNEEVHADQGSGDDDFFQLSDNMAGQASTASQDMMMDDASMGNPFGNPALSASQDSLSKDFSRVHMREEPDCIKKWKVEQEERLRVKDADEEEKKNELREKAKKELDDWYKRYEEQLSKTKTTNRSAQEELVTEMNNIVPGTEWERVAKHCDFNPKSTRHTKDVSRMRSLLLQLKQNPPNRE